MVTGIRPCVSVRSISPAPTAVIALRREEEEGHLYSMILGGVFRVWVLGLGLHLYSMILGGGSFVFHDTPMILL